VFSDREPDILGALFVREVHNDNSPLQKGIPETGDLFAELKEEEAAWGIDTLDPV
jgi:hypothetical protein